MFNRGRRPWRNAHRWVRNEQGMEPQQFQSDDINNPDIPPQQEFCGDNFTAGRGGKKRDFQAQNAPDPGPGIPHFGKKPKSSFKNNDFSGDPSNHFGNHPQPNMHPNHPRQNMHQNHPQQNMHQNHPPQNMHQNHQQHNVHQNMHPNHPQQIMRPNHPPHNMRPNHPQPNMRPNHPQPNMRPNYPQPNMRPNHPQPNMRPNHPHQNMRPPHPQQNMRPNHPQQNTHRNHPQQIMRPNHPQQNMRPNHSEPNMHPIPPQQIMHQNHPQQNMHEDPQMHPPYFENQSEEGDDDFPPQHMSMDSVPFRCSMCGKPFKKQVLLDMHLNTECKAVMNEEGPHFPPNNFQRGNNFCGLRGGPRRRGRGRRGGFNHNFNLPIDNYNVNDGENPESWTEYESENFSNVPDNFSNNEFPQQHLFRGNRGRGRGRGFHRPPHRGGPMGPRPPFNPEFQNNNLNDGSYPPDQYDENSNNYDGSSGDQFNIPNHNPPQSNRPPRPQHFQHGASCNLCNLQCNTLEELQFHKEKFHLRCKFCIAFFATKPDLYLHQETHLIEENSVPTPNPNPSEPFNGGLDMQPGSISTTCEICSETFMDQESLSAHLQNDHGQLPLPPMFPLPEDVEGFSGPGLGPGEIIPVESIPEQVISFPCCLCVTNYSSIDELSEHISAVHPPAIVCKECGNVFRDEEQIQGHHKYEHTTNTFPEKERQAILAHTDYYPCEMCSEVQCNPPALQYHMHFHRVHNLQHETKIRTTYVPCPECNVMIKSNGLKNHILNNHKSISCNVCQQVFSEKFSFVKHVDLEHYPNCVCNICCAICFNNNALQQHGATEHAMGEMFKCNFCAKRFGLRTLLSVHELLHSEVFSQCKVCGEFFKTPELMLEFRSHMVDIHGMDSSMFV